MGRRLDNRTFLIALASIAALPAVVIGGQRFMRLAFSVLAVPGFAAWGQVGWHPKSLFRPASDVDAFTAFNAAGTHALAMSAYVWPVNVGAVVMPDGSVPSSVNALPLLPGVTVDLDGHPGDLLLAENANGFTAAAAYDWQSGPLQATIGDCLLIGIDPLTRYIATSSNGRDGAV